MIKPPSEHEEQKVFCEYLNFMGFTFYAVPNGTYLNGSPLQRAKQMNRLKSEGLQSGVPDIVILLDGGKSVYIEMKRKNGGVLSKEQKVWIERLKSLGFPVYVCKGSEEAISVAKMYLPYIKKGL